MWPSVANDATLYVQKGLDVNTLLNVRSLRTFRWVRTVSMPRLLHLLTILLASTHALAGDPPKPPSKKALDLVEQIAQASRAGVDHAGSLWAWDQSRGGVDFISGEGERTSSVARELALSGWAIDADREWGIALVTDHGRRIVLLPARDGIRRSVALPHSVGGICWLGKDQVAVSPETTRDRVEVWNLANGKRLSAFGTAQPVESKPGVVTPRNAFLRRDFSTGNLVYLEGTTGEVQVYNSAGHLLRSFTLPLPERAKDVHKWLAAADVEARAANRVKQMGYVTWDGFSLDSAGTAWVVDNVDHAAGRIDFIRIARNGAIDRTSLTTPGCTSYRFAIWGDSVVVHRDMKNPLKACTSIRRLP